MQRIRYHPTIIPTARSRLFSVTHFQRRKLFFHVVRSNVPLRASAARFRTSRLIGPRSAASSLSNNPSTEDPTELSVEEQYSRKTPIEHVLLRPGMYVGPVERLPPNQCWVPEPTPPPPPASEGESLVSNIPPPEVKSRMLRKEYGLVPALIKIFDEILVNASDNHLRNPETCTQIEVDIHPGDPEQNKLPSISVFNDGKGIPVQMHRDENLWLPDMLFGHLLTGSNFDDTEKRVTGGRHGYGAKLTNIFSKQFSVETLDSSWRLRYHQTWTDNMSSAGDPEITEVGPGDKDYTKITFVPDMPKLTGDPHATAIAPEDYATMCRRVLDVAGCAAGKLKVILNGRDVSMGSFAEYCGMYRPEDALPVCYTKVNPRWEVAIGLSENGSFDGVSFVNGMSTTRGGTHVNLIVQQVSKTIQNRVSKLHPELAETVTTGLIRRNLFVACNALIENPTFDSQMKESLTSGPTTWGSNCTFDKKFLGAIIRPEEEGGPGIVEEVIRVAQGRQQANLLKEVGGGKATKRQLLAIPKLEDAHSAGSENSAKCTLILTEGDSAKALAVAGLEVIGREHYGVFPLRGKFLNVRIASIDQLTRNVEVKALCSILGLDFDKEYDTVQERAELRYGRVMLMTDQDTDGSHIKGLVINFFRHFWPRLLKPAVDDHQSASFLSSFITPLLKVSRKGKKERLSFYSMAEYKLWRESLQRPDEIKKWTVKYYKGLGTSTPAEAKEYFRAYDSHVRPFLWNSETDGELLDMLFDKTRAADRREWILNEYDADASIEVDEGNEVSYEDFVNKEMVHFSNADNVRSLPSVIDGLKPSQRKVLYACFKRKLKSEVKVAQLSGYCAEHTAYHHGEASLHATIISMAQDYVGSNNVNLLVPSGQFGTRLVGGKDAASPRYIFTHLSPISRYLFPEADDVLLSHQEDDGQIIEPEFYCPVIPLLLVNGCQGIGTGWSTFVPPHNPIDVLNYIRAKLDREDDLPPIEPWARGFQGTIESRADGKGYTSVGNAEVTSDTTVHINELPIGSWTVQYKDYLLSMRRKGEIRKFVENHTTTSVSFVVTTKSVQLDRMVKSGLRKVFRLESSLPKTNMHAFDVGNVICKFENPEAIADAFFPVRLSLYRDRKSVQESEMKYDALVMQNKARFIQAVADGQVDLVRQRRTKDETVASMRNLGFDSAQHLRKIRQDNVLASRMQSTGGDEEFGSSDFDYLLNMPLSSLTSERMQGLHGDYQQKQKDLEQLQNTSEEDLWRHDLDQLENQVRLHP